MPAAKALSAPLYVELVATTPGADGEIVRISATREDGSTFDRLIRGPRLTLGQAKLTGLTNTQLENGSDLEVVLQDLLEFSGESDVWIVPEGDTARNLFYVAARSTGFPRYPGVPLIGIDEVAAVVLPTIGRRDIPNHYASATSHGLRETWKSLKADLLKLPLPLLSEMNWLLSRADHPLKRLLKSAEGEAVSEQFTDTITSGKLSLDKLFKDYSEIIDRLKPEEDDGGIQASDLPPQTPVDASEIGTLLGSDGPLAKNLDGYEDRPEQLAMAQSVGESLTEGKHLIAEAGTGIGKSLAYLIPSILFAKRAGRPVMISTHTKNLQSQLYEKDLPFLRKHLGIEFESALLKGRPNYLCLRKFTYTLQESHAELDDEDRGKLLPVMTWATQTETGDVTELSAFSREQSPELWDRLHTVGDDCLKRQCPFYKRCFVYKARGLTRDADVVVLNHALVFSDLNVESGVLPPYNEIVFDEGHKLEDVATEHLSTEVTPRRVYRILNRLFKTSQGSSAGKGLLPALLNGIEMARSEFPDALITSIREHILTAIQEIDPANHGSDTFFETVRHWTDEPQTDEPDFQSTDVFVPIERGRGGATMARDEFAQQQPQNFPFKRKKPRQIMGDRRRFSAQTLRPDETERLTEGKESAISRLGRLRQALDKLEEDFKEIRKRSVPRAREILKELEAQNLFLQELIGDIEFVIRGDEPNYVYWSEPLGRRGARVIAAPLDVAPLLHAQLYEKKRSVVITSATLSVRDAEADDASGLAPIRNFGVSKTKQSPAVHEEEAHGSETYDAKPHPKSFEFLKTRLGLNFCSKEKLDELLLGSPFDYDNQCRLYVPTFIPEPGGPREKDFTAAFTDMLGEVIVASGGRAMVLYTSYSALEASAAILRKILTPHGIEVIAQGSDGSRESLLARLKEGGRTALLGTASFWEGVDVRGEALSLLVIAKLPFAVFTDPIIQGRCELLEKSGKDPFLHFSVPQAILRLRQGFGRLIRSKADRGVVILGDKRVLTKRYGAAFLRALPARARAIANCDALAQDVREFLE
jgi:Rad3-related DNA helicase